VVQVERVGVCGTDVELFTGEMAYFEQGYTSYPIRPGHEWCGEVVDIGEGVDRRWMGRRVVADQLIGDSTCRRCRRGAAHVCEYRQEIGVRDGRPGALAEMIAVPSSSLFELPDEVDSTLGALVEPGGNALRAAKAAFAREGDSVLVVGPGTIGIMTALFLQTHGADVHLLGPAADELTFAQDLGFEQVWVENTLPDIPFDAVIDASNACQVPARALELVEPAGRLVYIGLAGSPSLIDSRMLALKDVVAVGVFSASPGFEETIRLFADITVDPRSLVAETIGLNDVGAVLSGERSTRRGSGPKVHVDPTRQW
jgi:threonine dehydrogenase-like Zn-dependent dehydrogenase